MWEDFGAAVALMLIFEGLMPFASPQSWREWITSLLQQDDRLIRRFGFISMLLGVLLLFAVRNGF